MGRSRDLRSWTIFMYNFVATVVIVGVMVESMGVTRLQCEKEEAVEISAVVTKDLWIKLGMLDYW